MNNFRVLITDPIDPVCREILENQDLQPEERSGLTEAQLIALLAGNEGGGVAALIVRSGTRVTERLIERMAHVRLIARAGAGVDNIALAAATHKHILVMNTPGANTLSVAEHTIAMMFALARNIPMAHAELQSGTWNRKRWMGVELSGKTLGVIGFGRIGKAVAAKARALGMRVLAADALEPVAAAAAEAEPATLPQLLAASDFISLHVPLNDATRGMIGAAELALCKPGVCIVNCARGGIVDETALFAALESGAVAGAALDVFADEPPPPENPLLHHLRVVVTPHIGAATREAQRRVAEQTALQVADALLRRRYTGIINPEAVEV